MRVMEIAEKRNMARLFRFPLFPGSLLIMDGTTQNDYVFRVRWATNP